MIEQDKPSVYLVDGSGYLFRAYHAIRYLSTSKGVPTNAVLGVTKMLNKMLKERKPKLVAVIWDPGGKNFRHEIFPDYKANRPPAPEDLKVQIPLVMEAVDALALPTIRRDGFEADDVIATMAGRAVDDGFDVVVVSSDKDLMQLVGPSVVMWDPMQNVTYDEDAVEKKWGVRPEQLGDLLGLMGDSSDNIPGVYGVGKKTAARLLKQYHSLDGVLDAAPSMKKSKLRERLMEQADKARLSRRLVELRKDVELGIHPGELLVREPDMEILDEFFSRMEFSSLRRELVGRQIDTSRYTTVRDKKNLEKVVRRIEDTKKVALDLETTSIHPMQASIVGISLCPKQAEAYYIPVAHKGPDVGEQLEISEVLNMLWPVISDPKISVYGQNIKYDAVVLENRHGLRLENIACDSMLASYVLDPGRTSHGLDSLSADFLGHDPIAYSQVAGSGKQQVCFDQVAVDDATRYSGEDADLTLRLCELLLPRVLDAGLENLLFEMELPVQQVLIDMELAGIMVDKQVLSKLSDECQMLMERSESRAYALAGREFNLNSPAQLRVVLFDELDLPVIKKTKSGPSTDQTVLEELSSMHELPAEILSYRTLAKLKSTYLDVLPGMILADTGRIHSSFNQAVTATGRLSSSDPNLQNIPIRTEMGKRVREAFVAPDGFVLLSADYSQVELRILAHMSGDENLLQAFSDGDDVHARTASKIFSVPIAQVTKEMRYRAKAVNFGIIYGQGPFNLARQLGLSRREAKEIIDSYLERYRGVAKWIEDIHEQARRQKFVTTLFGRRRFLPEIDARNHNVRTNAERMAQNTPIQGTAADIIKVAMINVSRELKRFNNAARIVLQVHDELVLEVPVEMEDEVGQLVKEQMEGAAKLDVALTVDISTGRSWAQAH